MSNFFGRISELINHASALVSILAMFGVTSLTGLLAYLSDMKQQAAYLALIALLMMVAAHLCYMLINVSTRNTGRPLTSKLNAVVDKRSPEEIEEEFKRMVCKKGYLRTTRYDAQKIKVGDYLELKY